MKNTEFADKMSELLGEIDGKYIAEAEGYKSRRRVMILRYALVAATVALLVSVVLVMLRAPEPPLPPTVVEPSDGTESVYDNSFDDFEFDYDSFGDASHPSFPIQEWRPTESDDGSGYVPDSSREDDSSKYFPDESEPQSPPVDDSSEPSDFLPEGSMSDESEPADGPSNEPSDGPPEQIVFNSFDEIAEMKSMLNKTDAELEAYLGKHSYDMNGLSERADVEKLFELFDSVQVFHLSSETGYIMSFMNLRYDINNLFISYENSVGHRVDFAVWLNPDTALSYESENAVGEVEVNGETVTLYGYYGEWIMGVCSSTSLPTGIRVLNSEPYLTDMFNRFERLDNYIIATTVGELIK